MAEEPKVTATVNNDVQIVTLSDSVGTGVSCDDEGYETAGKKVIASKSVKASNKDGRKLHDCPADDDGYETAGKKELVPPRVKSVDKQGRRSRGGSASPRSDRMQLPEQEKKDHVDIRVRNLIDALEGIITVDKLNNDAVQLLKLVPEGYIPLPHQVGGHRHIDGKVGFLRCLTQPHLLYKPVQDGSKGVREVSFYDALFDISSPIGSSKESFPLLSRNRKDAAELLPIIPTYYGVTNITDRAGSTCNYLILEDITHRFIHPCILDLKIGQRVWDDHADEDKIERERKKYPAQETLGFRIIGMRTYRPEYDDYVYYDRMFGRAVTENTAKEALSHFFETGDGLYRTDVIKSILSKLARFTEWMKTQRVLRLFATSLLIVYEGGSTVRDCCTEDSDFLDIRLVDFAHCYETSDNCKEPDSNGLYGVEVFINYLEQLKQEFCSN